MAFFSFIIPPILKLKKTQARLKLYSRIEALNIPAMAPYSRYKNRGLTCLVAPNSARYSRCIKASRLVKYNILGPSAESWRSLKREESKLNNEWRATQEQLLSLQAKLLRLNY